MVFEGAACPSHNDHACFSAYPVSPKRRLNTADKASWHPQHELLAVAGVFGWFVHVPSWPSPRNSFHLPSSFHLRGSLLHAHSTPCHLVDSHSLFIFQFGWCGHWDTARRCPLWTQSSPPPPLYQSSLSSALSPSISLSTLATGHPLLASPSGRCALEGPGHSPSSPTGSLLPCRLPPPLQAPMSPESSTVQAKLWFFNEHL